MMIEKCRLRTRYLLNPFVVHGVDEVKKSGYLVVKEKLNSCEHCHEELCQVFSDLKGDYLAISKECPLYTEFMMNELNNNKEQVQWTKESGI